MAEHKPIAVIKIFEPSEIADGVLDPPLLSAEKIRSLRVNELVDLGAAYAAHYKMHRATAEDYKGGMYLCAEALKDKGITEIAVTDQARAVVHTRIRFETR